ncbi:MAG: accessory gene regulator B family protein [Clostridia bacterium]|nr:accessory gene regulator B family protein [Clostridia bacterium]
MEKLAERFADRLVLKNICTLEEKPLYVYGMTLFLTTALVMLSIVTLSIVLFDVRYGVLYVVMFPMLRVCVGGYHCKTYASCFVVSNIIFVADAFFAVFICGMPAMWSALISVSIMLVSAAYIICNAPISNPKNPLLQKRKEKNRKKAIIRTTALTATSVACALAALKFPAFLYVSSTAASVEFTVALLMIIETIKQKGEKT